MAEIPGISTGPKTTVEEVAKLAYVLSTDEAEVVALVRSINGVPVVTYHREPSIRDIASPADPRQR